MIFSYQRSAPTARLRLNGATCESDSVMLGNDTANVESCVRWVIDAVVDIWNFELKRYDMLTVLFLVFSVNDWL